MSSKPPESHHRLSTALPEILYRSTILLRAPLSPFPLKSDASGAPPTVLRGASSNAVQSFDESISRPRLYRCIRLKITHWIHRFYFSTRVALHKRHRHAPSSSSACLRPSVLLESSLSHATIGGPSGAEMTQFANREQPSLGAPKDRDGERSRDLATGGKMASYLTTY